MALLQIFVTRVALIAEVGPSLKTISPRYAERVPLDNASLLARRVYASDLDVFVFDPDVGRLRGRRSRHSGHGGIPLPSIAA